MELSSHPPGETKMRWSNFAEEEQNMLKLAPKIAALIAVSIFLPASDSLAVGGTSVVATKGQAVSVAASWPKGVGEVINDETRSSGWNDWFSEWPNDVNHYGFEVASTADVNRLIKKLASIKSDLIQVRLSHMKEPEGLGWVTHLPKDNNIAVIFSIGDQSQIDEWYKHVRKPFGVMEFVAVPIAVPPTLTIFVQNELIDLDKLSIPKGITVESGYLPGAFYRSNTKQEKEREEADSKGESSAQPKVELDSRAQAIADKIDAFLKNRRD